MEEIVKDELSALDSNKSPGPDGFPSIFLCASSLASTLDIIFKASRCVA